MHAASNMQAMEIRQRVVRQESMEAASNMQETAMGIRNQVVRQELMEAAFNMQETAMGIGHRVWLKAMEVLQCNPLPSLLSWGNFYASGSLHVRYIKNNVDHTRGIRFERETKINIQSASISVISGSSSCGLREQSGDYSADQRTDFAKSGQTPEEAQRFSFIQCILCFLVQFCCFFGKNKHLTKTSMILLFCMAFCCCEAKTTQEDTEFHLINRNFTGSVSGAGKLRTFQVQEIVHVPTSDIKVTLRVKGVAIWYDLNQNGSIHFNGNKENTVQLPDPLIQQYILTAVSIFKYMFVLILLFMITVLIYIRRSTKSDRGHVIEKMQTIYLNLEENCSPTLENIDEMENMPCFFYLFLCVIKEAEDNGFVKALQQCCSKDLGHLQKIRDSDEKHPSDGGERVKSTCNAALRLFIIFMTLSVLYAVISFMKRSMKDNCKNEVQVNVLGEMGVTLMTVFSLSVTRLTAYGIAMLCMCGVVFFCCTKMNIGYGHLIGKEINEVKQFAICDSYHNKDDIQNTAQNIAQHEEDYIDLHDSQNVLSNDADTRYKMEQEQIELMGLHCPAMPGLPPKKHFSLALETTLGKGDELCRLYDDNVPTDMTTLFSEQHHPRRTNDSLHVGDEPSLNENFLLCKNEKDDQAVMSKQPVISTLKGDISRVPKQTYLTVDQQVLNKAASKIMILLDGIDESIYYDEDSLEYSEGNASLNIKKQWLCLQKRKGREASLVSEMKHGELYRDIIDGHFSIADFDIPDLPMKRIKPQLVQQPRKNYCRSRNNEQSATELGLKYPAIVNVTFNGMKRKNSIECEDVKKRRIYGVTSKPMYQCEYNEVLRALSLRGKKPVSEALVNFFVDLLALNRKMRIKQINMDDCRRMVDGNLTVNDVLKALPCFLETAIHNDLNTKSNAFSNKKESHCKIPGLDYKVSFNNSLPVNQKHLLMEQIFANDTHVGNDILSYAKDYCKGSEKKSVKTVVVVDETFEASTSEIEEIESQAANDETYMKKKEDISIQVSSAHFDRLSGVTSISKESLQKALNATEDTQFNDTFKNLKYKIVTKSPCKQNEVHGKFDKHRCKKNGKEFTPTEDNANENALLREIIWLRDEELPDPQIDFSSMFQFLKVFNVPESVMIIIDQIANGTPPSPHVSMKYELLRFCTLRSYPKENKPYLIKIAEAGFYYASDGDGVVCYCCGVRRYNWVADDNPMKIHERINPNCKFLKKNDEVNFPVQFFGPFSENLSFIESIPEATVIPQMNEDVNNDWAPERIRSPAPAPAPAPPSRQNETGTNSLGINTAIPKHTQYATKTAREASFSGWPDTSSHSPQELADAGFFFAGFGDCVRCFFCGIGLRHWAKEDSAWIEHARWSRNCVYVKQKKGEEFVNLVQLAIQYSQDNEAQSNISGNQLPAQEIEKILLSDAAQSVLEMGYQPEMIKKAIEQILSQNGNAKITAQKLMEKVLEIEEAENPPKTAMATAHAAASAVPPSAKPTPGPAKPEAAKEGIEAVAKSSAERQDKKGQETKDEGTIPSSKAISHYEEKSQDPKAIKAENEQLKEQTLCKVCLDNTVCIVFLPCGHLVTCADCAPAMRKCPICRALVKGTVRTYMS